MRILKKLISIFGVLFLVAVLSFSCVSTNYSTPLKVVERFISITEFDQGSYEDYLALYVDKNRVPFSRQEFDDYRVKHGQEYMFDVDNNDVASVTKHMKVVQKDESNAEVYWFPDINNADIKKATIYWSLIKKNGKWLNN
jgi:hypothetical protein